MAGFWFWRRGAALLGAGLLTLAPQPSRAQSPPQPNTVDHAALIQSWDQAALRRGAELYQSVCLACHGTPTEAGSLPTSRAFWKEPFKNGSDPFSVYRTLNEGLGQMPAWPFLTPRQCYDLIHYLREEFLKPHNQAAYTPVTPAYLAGLPKAQAEFKKTAEMLEFERGPKYLRMDFGPALFWTLQVAPGNIAQKGIAIRLDPGPGGVSKGRAWMLYDHDTLRAAAAWTGGDFVDWKGIAWDGSHQTHASIRGKIGFTTPPGPGWAEPRSGTWDDPRPLGRDGRPYGALPRPWSHFEGVHLRDDQVALAYSVGEARVLEQPGAVFKGENVVAFKRMLNIGQSASALEIRLAPASNTVEVRGLAHARARVEKGFHLLAVEPGDTPAKITILIGNAAAGTTRETLAAIAKEEATPADLTPLTQPGQPRWNPPVAVQGRLGGGEGPFAVDEIPAPAPSLTPGRSWMRLTGLDFFKDGDRAAVSTWNGDVWIVSGIGGDLGQVVWQRIASGLFQPLGVKILGETIHVACRDMIARLVDLNGDGEIDRIENFNNDHQVTEHFHEFAMGLQADAQGNLYYAKSARHALPAVVPHHGTLLKVSADGKTTEILANGFRAANGVCLNPDGSFFVTDQEGHWTPKNRINWVRPGRFYGNMMGYHDISSNADADMEQPLVWITNEMDRSPGELLWVESRTWGPLNGSLLNLSYGTGKIFLVPHERLGEAMQGGVVQLPIPDFPTGVMRGRFHTGNGHLYACGMYAWAGNRQQDGGFYRIRPTGKPTWLPTLLHARQGGMLVGFSDPIDIASAEKASNYEVKVWGLSRTPNYGSPHVNEHPLTVLRASARPDGKSVWIEMPGLAPTRGMEIKMTLKGADGAPFTRILHNSIHQLGPGVPPAQAR